MIPDDQKRTYHADKERVEILKPSNKHLTSAARKVYTFEKSALLRKLACVGVIEALSLLKLFIKGS